MDEINLDSFEKSILSDIKTLKPKSKKRGYAKQLVKKLYSVIEQALTNGCSYEEIATAILNKNVKISPATLKRYHTANRTDAPKKEESQNLIDVQSSEAKIPIDSDIEKTNTRIKLTSFSEANISNNLKVSTTSQEKELTVIEEKKQGIRPPILTGSSLTDDDYLEDFNDY